MGYVYVFFFYQECYNKQFFLMECMIRYFDNVVCNIECNLMFFKRMIQICFCMFVGSDFYNDDKFGYFIVLGLNIYYFEIVLF